MQIRIGEHALTWLKDVFFVVICGELVIWLVLIGINISAFCLIRRIRRFVEQVEEKRLLQQQNRYYVAQYLNTRKQWEKVQKMYHDMRNIYILELGYLKKKQYGLLQKHYESILGDLTCENTWIDTGNLGIDSILNYKREQAKEQGINIKTYTRIMGKITIGDGDLSIVFGNLLDNAMEAVERLEEKDKEIKVSVKSDKTALLIHISNKYEGERKKDSRGNYITDKWEKDNHGIGLKTVNGIVKKYQGSMEVNETPEEFCVQIFMYMTQEQ